MNYYAICYFNQKEELDSSIHCAYTMRQTYLIGHLHIYKILIVTGIKCDRPFYFHYTDEKMEIHRS